MNVWFKIVVPMLITFGAFAGVNVDIPEKKLKVIDENGKPVEGAVVEFSVSYESCYKFYPGVGNPCSQEYFVDMELISNTNGDVVLPAVSESKRNGFNTERKNIQVFATIRSFTNKELEDNYSSCGYSMYTHLNDTALSLNLIDHQELNNNPTSCFYLEEDESRIDGGLDGDILCQLSGTRDLGFVDGKRTHIDIPLVEAIEDYKSLCE